MLFSSSWTTFLIGTLQFGAFFVDDLDHAPVSENLISCDFDVDSLDYAHGLGQVVLGLDDFLDLSSWWTSFKSDYLPYPDFDVDGLDHVH